MAGLTPEIFWRWVGGRRFTLTCGAGLVNTGLLIARFIDQGTYLTLTLATVGAYIGANTAQKWKEASGASSN
jgi:hypothetical protein